MIAITARLAHTPLERIDQPLVLIDGEKIVSIESRNSRELPSSARLVEFKDAILAPGFIDIHIPGGAGQDVMQADAEGIVVIETLIA